MLLSAMALVGALAAAKAEDPASPAELRFRRVYAPANRMNDWPRGEGKYLPLESDEFQRLLGLDRSGGPDDWSSFVSRIVAAEYQAELSGEQLLRGRATLDITHSGKSAGMMSLEPCNAAISKTAWGLPGQDAKTELKKPLLGSGAGGRLQVLVEHSGKLGFDWSLAGQRDAGEAIEFSCEFPACPACILRLDLPENLTLTTDKGVVSGGEAAVEGRRRWRIDLGGNSRFHLRLAAAGAAYVRPPSALLGESSVYDFSPRGVDLWAQWKIRAHDEPLEKISVLLDPGLQLATAHLGETALPWTIEALSGDGGSRAVLSLPEPIKDTEQILRLGASAALTFDRPCRLPRMRPEGLFWQEGGITLIVPDPFLIERLTPVDCSQTAVGPLAEPRVGESLQFQNFSPDATIELTLARRAEQVRLATGTAVELGAGQMTARVIADLRSDDAGQYTLEADVANSWIIDSVETTPAESLADWSLENQSGEQRKLFIRLSKAPSPKQPLRLVINARRLRTFLTRQWSVGDLLPLRFTNPAEDKRLAAIQAADLYDLKLSNAEELSRLAARDLSPRERELFAAPPAGLLFEDNAGAAALEIALGERKPAFSGEVLVEVVASKDRLRENFILCLTPESAGIDRVIVQLSQPGKVPPRWTLVSEDDNPLSIRQWSKSEQAGAGLGAGGEIWELTLRRPLSAPFEICGTREAAFGDWQAVCLASLPEAGSQRGRLIIRGSGDKGLHIDNRRLKPILPEPVPVDEYSTVRATFRFDPLSDVTLAGEPALLLSAESGKNPPPIWVRNCRLESWYESQGGARHLAVFEVQNTGGNRLEIVLPRGVSNEDVRGLWVDDGPVDWQQGGEGASETRSDLRKNIMSAPLPAAKRFPAVSIYFITHQSGLGTFGSLAPPLPEVNVPVLSCTWSVWLPPGYEAVEEDRRRQGPHGPEITISRRLFGPLGRDPGQKAFNPFVAQDWLTSADGQGEFQPAESNSLLDKHLPAGCRLTDTQGWSVQSLEISAAQPAPIKYVHRRLWQLWAAVIFVLTLGVGNLKAAKYPISFAVLTGIFGILAFVLPEIYVPLASAAVLGMLACLLMMTIRSCVNAGAPAATPDRAGSEQSPSSSKTARLADQAGAILLIAAACVLFAGNGRADEGDEKTRHSASTDYRVFVPIDAENKPVGGKVYLPEKLFNELYRRAAEAKQEPRGWLLGSAVYRGSLEREAAAGRLDCEAIKAQFELRIFGRMVQVGIPFHRENARLIPDSATLDGRPIEVKWEADGAALSFEVEEPGDYRLELGFRPAPRVVGTSGGFEMSIPRLAQSRLELTLPVEIPGIEAASALGAAGLETNPPRFLAELGPSNRLAVHWPESQAKGGVETGIEADQLTWLKVQPGSVVVEARFKFHFPENQVRRLQFAADPRLHLLPFEGKDPPGVRIRSDGAKQQVIILQWNRPLDEETTVELSFFLTGASGVGKFRLPQIEPLDAQKIKRWLAVSVDPLLEYESQGSPKLEAATTEEFSKKWDFANSPPLLAYRLESDKSDLSISTRPREPETTAEQTLALSFDQNKVEVCFEAQLTVASGYVFQYQLSAPAGMKILKASVRKEGAELAERWSQDPGGTITIFLTGPADGKQQLSLHGVIPLENGEKTALPNIRLDRCRVESSTVEVFRRPEVDLELTLPEEINLPRSLEEGQGEGISEKGRLVKTFRLEGESPVQGEVRIRANRPKTDAKQVTRMYFDGQKWMAQADFLLDVTDGAADRFWIEAPKSWKEPYVIDPPATVKVVEIPGETRQLIVQPKSAVRGEYRFSIGGALEIEPGQPPAAPEIRLSKTEKYSRWLVLPRHFKGQPADWETRGLRPAELPAPLAALQNGKDNFAYEIIGETPKAALHAQAAAPGSAKVRLADVQLAWQADGACHGTTIFDLEPGGQTFCPLNLPERCELVYAAIDGQPASPIPNGPGKWRLPLASERLPQRVEVVYRGVLADPLVCGPRGLTAPGLGDLPIARTLWTVFIPPPLIFQSGKEDNTKTLNSQQWIRFHDAVAAIASAENLLPSDDAEETLRWYQARSRYLYSALSALQRELALMPDSESVRRLIKEIETVDQDQAEFANRIGLAKVWTQAKAESNATNEAADYRRQWLGESGNVARYVVDGPATSISIELKPAEHIGPAGRITASLCLAVVVGLFILGLRRGTWAIILKDRPYAVGIAAGLAWWCWLWPSILGMALILVCLVSWWLAHRKQTAAGILE